MGDRWSWREAWIREDAIIRYRVCSGLLLVLSLFVLVISTERRAYAYVDPGSSLVIFQGIGAAFSAALFYFRKRLYGLFRRSDSRAEGQETVLGKKGE